MNKIIECVPNFSNGRDPEILEKIVAPFRGKENVKLLDYESDKDHNRSVVTVIGTPEELKKTVVEAVGKIIWEQHNIPVFLYEKSASAPHRENLSAIRKGQFEGMAEKIKQSEWKPDFGGTEIHASAGVTAVGCRMPLVAFNVNLASKDLSIADKIAKKVRFIGGGLRFVKAMGVDLTERGIVQVSMNMTDYTKTALYQSYEMVKMEARRYGVNVVGTEIVGLTPMAALMDVASYYLQIENFEFKQIIEARLLE